MAASRTTSRGRKSAAPAGPSPSEVARAWAKGKLPRVVMILGPESALREEALKGIRTAAFGDGDGGMNWIVYHGPDGPQQSDAIEPATVLDEVCTLPMFAAPDEPKVVVVRNAGYFLNTARTREFFEQGLERVPDAGVLVLELGEPGKLKSTRLYKSIAKEKAVVACEALRDPWGGDGPDSPLAAELARRARGLGLKLNAGAAAALIDRSGQNLGVLEEELGKLSLALSVEADGGRGVDVDEQTIERVCANTRLADPFEFADALTDRDARKGMEVLGTIFSHGLGDYKRPGRVVTNESEIAMRLLGVCTWKLTQLQDVHAALRSGKREYEVFQAFKVFGKNRTSIQRAVRKFTPVAMRGAIEALLKANIAMRTGGAPHPTLEKLVWDVCRG